MTDTRRSAPLGYVVLTAQPDETWRDDWDGEVHATPEAAASAFAEACDALGPDFCKLVELHEVSL